jgi:hypothetical protein
MKSLVQSKALVLGASIVMLSFASAAFSMPFCGKSDYGSKRYYPHPMMGYAPAPAYYAPAHHGYGHYAPQPGYMPRPANSAPQATKQQPVSGQKGY